MTVAETILYFAVPPAAVYLIITLLVVGPRMRRRPRYRAGKPWPFPPVWWTANPKGAQLPPAEEHPPNGMRGGARGTW